MPPNRLAAVLAAGQRHQSSTGSPVMDALRAEAAEFNGRSAMAMAQAAQQKASAANERAKNATRVVQAAWQQANAARIRSAEADVRSTRLAFAAASARSARRMAPGACFAA